MPNVTNGEEILSDALRDRTRGQWEFGQQTNCNFDFKLRRVNIKSRVFRFLSLVIFGVYAFSSSVLAVVALNIVK